MTHHTEEARTGTDQPRFGGIILAGGKSSRMGRDKAGLCIKGRTLLQIQTEKLREAGAAEILISGTCSPLPGTQAVPDVWPDRGPLGGLHACLAAAKEPVCLVLSVDVPLLPEEVLRELIKAHAQNSCRATLLSHGGKAEPLIAVYDSGLAAHIGTILQGDRYAVWRLLDDIRWGVLDWDGDDRFLLNCNTPEDYERLCRLAESL